MKRSQSSIQDRLGLLQVSAVNAAMSALVKTVQVRLRVTGITQHVQHMGSDEQDCSTSLALTALFRPKRGVQ